MNRRRWMYAVVSFCALALAFVAWRGLPVANGAEDKVEALEGKPAPDFSLATVDGKDIKLSDLKGKIVVLDFWATWCPPCRLSLPHIQELSNKKDLAEKGLKVLTVNADEKKAEIENFTKANKYSFEVAMDKGSKVMNQYGISGIPTTILVGRDGKVKNVWVEFDPKESPKALDEAIEKALKEEPKK